MHTHPRGQAPDKRQARWLASRTADPVDATLSCSGKVRLPSRKIAVAHARKIEREAGVTGGRPLEAYRCRHCVGFHVGHRPLSAVNRDEGARLRDLRVGAGVSLEMAAYAFGLAPQTLSHVENGRVAAGEWLAAKYAGLAPEEALAEVGR